MEQASFPLSVKVLLYVMQKDREKERGFKNSLYIHNYFLSY